MRPSRGMGAVRKSVLRKLAGGGSTSMPKGVRKKRRDSTKFLQFKNGGKTKYSIAELKKINPNRTLKELEELREQNMIRVDGTIKSLSGYLGPRINEYGDTVTEMSIGVIIEGKETEVPAMVPTLTKKQIKQVMSGDPKKITEDIQKKAREHALERIKKGESPFANKSGDPRSTGKYKSGGSVNKAKNYTKPSLRKRLFNQVKAASTHGTGAGKWSARKAQLLAKKYKAAGGGYRS